MMMMMTMKTMTLLALERARAQESAHGSWARPLRFRSTMCPPCDRHAQPQIPLPSVAAVWVELMKRYTTPIKTNKK
eukprot:5826930-Prymnesium_polylepis.1